MCSVNAVKKITVLHLNDIHARFEETNEDSAKCSLYEIKNNLCFGGFARVNTALKKFREKAKNEGRGVLTLVAGDVFQGSLYFNFFKSEICSKMMSLLSVDAMVSNKTLFILFIWVLLSTLQASGFTFLESYSYHYETKV